MSTLPVGFEYVNWIAVNPPAINGIVNELVRTNEPPHVKKVTWRVVDESGRVELVETIRYRIIWQWDATLAEWRWRFVTQAEMDSGWLPVFETVETVIDDSEAVAL